jgi:hypothetical protein
VPSPGRGRKNRAGCLLTPRSGAGYGAYLLPTAVRRGLLSFALRARRVCRVPTFLAVASPYFRTTAACCGVMAATRATFSLLISSWMMPFFPE